ncbi:MAG TPA: hypothetical protein G4O02_18810 [Caldilineae bacterium]|nr:hypothetical protein [Caldilineae bacterium]
MSARPYWHVDAKWIFGLLLTGVLAVWLVLVGLWQLTRREAAIGLFVEAGMGLLYPAPPAAQAFDEMLARARERPEATVQVMGLRVPLKGREVVGLPREEAARRVFRRLGEVFYDEGPEGLARLRLPDAEGMWGESSGPLGLFNAQSHQAMGLLVGLGGLVILLLLAPVIYFSAGWGRLASPGVCLVVASLPGWPLMAISTLPPQREGPPPAVRLVARASAPVYELAVGLGFTLIIVAILGGLIRRLRR